MPTLNLPVYRHHKPSGQAVVTLRDSRTGQRRDVYLGVHLTPASHRRYADVVAAWDQASRTLDGQIAPVRRCADDVTTPAGDTVAALAVDFFLYFVKPNYNERAADEMRRALKVLRSVAGRERASTFGPRAMKRVRDAMIEQGWSFNTCKRRLQVIRRAFAWGVEEERVPGSVHHALTASKILKRNTPGMKARRAVMPAPEGIVYAIRPHVAPQVWALIELQLVTGARPGELVGLRAIDLDTSGGVWTHVPAEHKSAHRGRRRIIPFGPRAQNILKPYLQNRSVDAPLFSPREAVGLLRAAKATKGKPRRPNQSPTACATERSIGDAYTVDAYRRAIERGCDATFPPPPDMKHAELKAWRLEHRFSPHQLRHNCATNVRRDHGIESASVLLGHKSATLTAHVYAERDEQKVLDLAAKIG